MHQLQSHSRRPLPPLFARSHDWWTWDHSRIREALQASRLLHISTVIDAALDANAQAGREPSTWSDLCDEGRIRRDTHHFMKIKRGAHGFNDLILLGLATALFIDVRKLCPTTGEWLAQATMELCQFRITLSDANAYVCRRLTPGPTQPSRNGCPASRDEAVIAKVCGVLDPILQAIDREIEEKRRTS